MLEYNSVRKLEGSLRSRKRLYGLSKEDLIQLVQAQGWRCANENCRAALVILDSAQYDFVQIDHDHTTGKVRGALCNHCNWGIGQFKDSLVLLQGAISYLGKFDAANTI